MVLKSARARGPVVEIFSISFFANNARIMIIYVPVAPGPSDIP